MMQTASSSRPIPGPSRPRQDFYPISPSPRYAVGSPYKYGSVNGGSYRNQFYPGCSPGMMGPLDIPDFKRSIATSIESEHGSLIRALSGEMPSMEGEMSRDYTCCGITLTDLHALVEHYPIDDMDLDPGHSSSGASSPSPPDTPVLPFDTTSIRRSTLYPNNPNVVGTANAFNRYAGYTEFSTHMPGTMETPMMMMPGMGMMMNKSLPPALLTASQTASPMSTPPQSPAPSTTLSRPASSLLLSKPFRCPKEGCNKSYKQANGLKYHIQHGSCNFTPQDPSLDGMSDKEAERKLRPYQCQVPPCTRRYKNMNGLRYHYQHSGAHGAIGLALIQSGLHEDSKKTQGGRTSGMHSASHSAPNTQPPSPVTSTPTSPLHTPMAMHHHQPFFGSSQDVNMG
ncbi:hypothetical protein SISSUDRAFT_756732 [Sistotremastrum suecicum HHB10207 ss-3]|uniref:C2H2-type domain-containing protein n=1 Tax=Sistotremastrum suecicum HHB10207 ss-3 TaxID=1314776 RepID=A0A166DCY7_9AGAM|nr:hypothetical protein SISSUDRAFT_756732 [Sistotremastrum suecicum HHB10207 ss-3]